MQHPAEIHLPVDLSTLREILAWQVPPRAVKYAPAERTDYRNPLAVEICIIQRDGVERFGIMSQLANVFIKNALLKTTSDPDKVELLFKTKDYAYQFAITAFSYVKNI